MKGELDECVTHALKVREAYNTENYWKFFQLYMNAPKLSARVIDFMIVNIRVQALKEICKAFKPSIGLEFLSKALGYDSKEECQHFVVDCGATWVYNNGVPAVDCKSTIKKPLPKTAA